MKGVALWLALAALVLSTPPAPAQEEPPPEPELPLRGDDEPPSSAPVVAPSLPVVRQVTARVTAYCLSGTTRSGTPTHSGVVATDPSVIPLGSNLTIEGLGGTYRAEDTGGGVRGAHVDVWMASCAQARAWGVQYRQVAWWPPS
jgi:3D (Asp-Asp-Asp) domain-containing protein